ncbi:DNA ligase, partial [Clarias magur]
PETLQVRAIPEHLHCLAESPVCSASVHAAKTVSYHQQTSACVPRGSVGRICSLAFSSMEYWH